MNSSVKELIIKIIEFLLSVFTSSSSEPTQRQKTVDKTHSNLKDYLKKFKK